MTGTGVSGQVWSKVTYGEGARRDCVTETDPPPPSDYRPTQGAR